MAGELLKSLVPGLCNCCNAAGQGEARLLVQKSPAPAATTPRATRRGVVISPAAGAPMRTPPQSASSVLAARMETARFHPLVAEASNGRGIMSPRGSPFPAGSVRSGSSGSVTVGSQPVLPDVHITAQGGGIRCSERRIFVSSSPRSPRKAHSPRAGLMTSCTGPASSTACRSPVGTPRAHALGGQQPTHVFRAESGDLFVGESGDIARYSNAPSSYALDKHAHAYPPSIYVQYDTSTTKEARGPRIPETRGASVFEFSSAASLSSQLQALENAPDGSRLLL